MCTPTPTHSHSLPTWFASLLCRSNADASRGRLYCDISSCKTHARSQVCVCVHVYMRVRLFMWKGLCVGHCGCFVHVGGVSGRTAMHAAESICNLMASLPLTDLHILEPHQAPLPVFQVTLHQGVGVWGAGLNVLV